MKSIKFLIVLLIFLKLNLNIYSQVSGTVFQDFNGNGIRDLTSTIPAADGNSVPVAIDAGFGGITITAYNTLGVTIGTTTSANDGSYTIPALTGAIRLEFTNIPSGYFSTANGSNSNSSVQFVTAPATNVNFGINSYVDYSQTNTNFVISEVQPLQYTGVNSGNQSIISIPFNYGSTSSTVGTTPTGYNVTPTVLATYGQTGSVRGIAWQRSKNIIYAGAYVKQFTDLGPAGTGGIYKIDISNPSSPVVTYLDLNAILGANTFGANPFIPYPDYSVTADKDRVEDAVYTTAMGDVDISEDDKWLYVTNLYDKKIYSIPVDGSPINSSTIIVSPTIPYNNLPVPWYPIPSGSTTMPLTSAIPLALTTHNGKVYVGVSVGYYPRTATSDPIFYPDKTLSIYEYDRATNTFNLTPIMNTDVSNAPGGGGSAEYDRRGWPKYFKGAIADISFTSDGGIAIAMRSFDVDINGGSAAGNPLLKACPIAANVWQIEDTYGTCGGVQGAGYSATGTTTSSQATFYAQTGAEGASALGGVAQIPGYPSITYLKHDPYHYFTAGLSEDINVSGAFVREAEFSPGFTIPATAGIPFDAKSGVLGDIEALSDLAPLEIGNLVWFDADKDGIQDAGEVPISGVVVELLNSSNMLIATDTTDANGNYYFSNGFGTNTSSSKYGLSLLAPNMGYIVRLPNISGSNKQSALTNYNLTASNVGGVGQADVRDSDGSINGNNADVSILTTEIPIAGANNHTFDFGFYYCPADSIKICNGMTAELVADDGYTNYKWYKINAPGDTVLVGSGQTFTTSTLGNYIYKAVDVNSCPILLCCPVTVADSVCCVITNLNLVIGNCDNKGTLTNANDDEYTFTLNPTGTGIGSTYTVNGLPNSPQTGTYGSPSTFGPYPIIVGVLNITVTDNTTSGCTATGSVTPPQSCSECNVLPPTIIVTDNVCPSRTGTINVAQNCGAGTFIQYSTNNGISWNTFKPLYSTTPITILSRCVNSTDTTCKSLNSTVTTDPKKCTNQGSECSVISNATINPCNNNGTDNDATDDYFTIQINASVTNGGSSNKYEVVIGADSNTGIGGNVLNSGGTTYGSPVIVGNTKIFKADGLTSYQLIIRDINNNNCFQTINIDPVVTCSIAPPKSPCYPVPCVPIGVIKN